MDDRRPCIGGRKSGVEGAVDESAPGLEVLIELMVHGSQFTATCCQASTVNLLFKHLVRLERLGDGLPFRVRENGLDLFLDLFEALMAETGEADSFLEELQRLVERQLFALEALHDFLELLERLLELVRSWAGGHRAAL
jgi:hypothetical protein